MYSLLFWLILVALASSNGEIVRRNCVSSNAGCDILKRCSDDPHGSSDVVGQRVCSSDKLATDCLTTLSAPFYTCLCECGRCTRAGENCESACGKAPPSDIGQSEKLFVVGGYNGQTGNIKSVDAFDFGMERWTHISNLPTARHGIAAASLNGRIYILGGGENLTTVYDPAGRTWRQLRGPKIARSNLAVVPFSSKIYVIGGKDARGDALKNAEVFDPSVEEWTNSANINTARYGHAVGVIGDQIFVIGGSDGHHALNSVERYDPFEGLWFPMPSMRLRRYGLCATVIGEKLYAIGGYNGRYLRSVEFFSANSTSWTHLKTGLSIARSGASAISVSGLLYVIGGFNGSAYLDTVEVYDPQTDSWRTLRARMTVGRCWAAASVLTPPSYTASHSAFSYFAFFVLVIVGSLCFAVLVLKCLELSVKYGF